MITTDLYNKIKGKCPDCSWEGYWKDIITISSKNEIVYYCPDCNHEGMIFKKPVLDSEKDRENNE